jgi:hypothetical protein
MTQEAVLLSRTYFPRLGHFHFDSTTKPSIARGTEVSYPRICRRFILPTQDAVAFVIHEIEKLLNFILIKSDLDDAQHLCECFCCVPPSCLLNSIRSDLSLSLKPQKFFKIHIVSWQFSKQVDTSEDQSFKVFGDCR